MSIHVAIDVGSSSGKIYYGWCDGETLHFEGAHRFDEITTRQNNRLVWNIDHILSEISTGLQTVESEAGSIDSLAIDTTAGDFGFVRDDKLITDPYFFYDDSLHSMEDELLKSISRREIFEQTGHPGIPNSLYYQYYSNTEMNESTDSLVMIPQLLSSELGADLASEETYAMTLRILDARTRDWAEDLIEILDLSMDILPDLAAPGRKIGSIDPPYADKLDSDPDILLAPSHDTASAMAALPLVDGTRAFLSTGSWIIPGLELKEPIITDKAFEIGAANELSVGGKIRFLQNIPGFALLEDCRETWSDKGKLYAYEDLLAAVDETEPHGPLIDPLDDRFFDALGEGGVINKIREYCDATGQQIPTGEGEITRCLLESLATRSAIAIEDLGVVAEGHARRLHVVGGGVRNKIFCQMMASALGHPVEAGPVEATAIGNVISQMVAAGEIASYERGRRLVEMNVDLDRYEPRNWEAWDETVTRMRQLIDGHL